ncbi:hypothetical protein FACS1894139_04360 [Planctomycetales bacterium]|nr:hypothetical protein FACS1894107_02020 [Planctomycetales bacterium]GHS99210.1 hypothetical protein FACS1894108_08770 [Planctomycetales bacterium]GHT03635.1 hypothetical protein FACS1894139_04360 [Planctomycetales bacterium]
MIVHKYCEKVGGSAYAYQRAGINGKALCADFDDDTDDTDDADVCEFAYLDGAFDDLPNEWDEENFGSQVCEKFKGENAFCRYCDRTCRYPRKKEMLFSVNEVKKWKRRLDEICDEFDFPLFDEKCEYTDYMTKAVQMIVDCGKHLAQVINYDCICASYFKYFAELNRHAATIRAGISECRIKYNDLTQMSDGDVERQYQVEIIRQMLAKTRRAFLHARCAKILTDYFANINSEEKYEQKRNDESEEAFTQIILDDTENSSAIIDSDDDWSDYSPDKLPGAIRDQIEMLQAEFDRREGGE